MYEQTINNKHKSATAQQNRYQKFTRTAIARDCGEAHHVRIICSHIQTEWQNTPRNDDTFNRGHIFAGFVGAHVMRKAIIEMHIYYARQQQPVRRHKARTSIPINKIMWLLCIIYDI